MVIATEKTYVVHIKYRKLNLIGRHGVYKEARTGFCGLQLRSLCAPHRAQHVTRKYLPRVSAYLRALLYIARVSILDYSWCAVYMHFTACA